MKVSNETSTSVEIKLYYMLKRDRDRERMFCPGCTVRLHTGDVGSMHFLHGPPPHVRRCQNRFRVAF